MKISACWIVKNEEGNIGRSISSVKNCADELIVVDTGSTDGTMLEAEETGATVLSYEWNDDFSAARNYALSQTEGDYIIFLDADEFFSPPLGEADNSAIQRRFEETSADILYIFGTETDESMNMTIDTRLCDRIIRRSTVRYENKIHELPRKNDGEKMNTAVLYHLHIIHTGYSADRLSEKLRRNIDMLEKEQTFLTDGYKLFLNKTYLMRDSYINKEFEKAADACQYLIQNAKYFKKACGEYPDLYRRQLYVAINLAVRFPLKIKKNSVYKIIITTLKNCFPNTREAALADIYYLMKFGSDETEFYRELAVDEIDAAPDSYLPECILVETEIYRKASEIAFNKGDIEKAEFFAEKMVNCNRAKKISACWIVKNEAENIKTSIESVKNCADELIVVDTGSTDKTVRIAEECGAKIARFAWINDFSSAKNYALSLANCDYVIFIDADEHFSPFLTQADKAYFLAVFRETKADVLYIYRREIEKTDGTEIDLQVYERVLRRSLIHYENRVHEVPRLSGGEVPKGVIMDGYLLLHTGYSKNVINQKAYRNLEILESEHKRLIDPLKLFMNDVYLMRENYVIGKNDKAADYFVDLLAHYEHFGEACKFSPYGYIKHFYQAAHLAEQMRFRFSRRELYGKLFVAFKENYADTRDALLADMHYQLRFDYREDRFLRELEELEAILSIAPPAGKDCRYIESRIFERAAEAWHRRGDRERTCRCALRTMQYDTFIEGRPLLLLLYAVKDFSPEDAERFLSHFVSTIGRPDIMVAVAALLRAKDTIEQLFNNGSQDVLEVPSPKAGVVGATWTENAIMFKEKAMRLMARMRYDDIANDTGAASAAAEDHACAYCVACAHLIRGEYNEAYRIVRPHVTGGALDQNLLSILLITAEKASQSLASEARNLYEDCCAMLDEGIELSDVINSGVVYGADPEKQARTVENMSLADFIGQYKTDQNRPVTNNLLEAHSRASGIFEMNGCVLDAISSYRFLAAKGRQTIKNKKKMIELFRGCGNREIPERLEIMQSIQ